MYRTFFLIFFEPKTAQNARTLIHFYLSSKNHEMMVFHSRLLNNFFEISAEFRNRKLRWILLKHFESFFLELLNWRRSVEMRGFRISIKLIHEIGSPRTSILDKSSFSPCKCIWMRWKSSEILFFMKIYSFFRFLGEIWSQNW